MGIHHQVFDGKTPRAPFKEYMADKKFDTSMRKRNALAELNEWRADNPDINLISIETIEYTLGPSYSFRGGYFFDGYRVWFEVNDGSSQSPS